MHPRRKDEIVHFGKNHIMGIDYAEGEGGKNMGCEMVYDPRTGVYTVLWFGEIIEADVSIIQLVQRETENAAPALVDNES